MATLTITHVKCNYTSESSHDEIYLKISGEKVWNCDDINDGQTKDVNVDRSFAGDVNVELWEEDSGSADDLLGSITVSENLSGIHTAEANGDGGSYNIQYKVS